MSGGSKSEPLPDALLTQAAAWLARIQTADATDADFCEWQEWLTADPAHARAYDAVEEVWSLAAQVRPGRWPGASEAAAQAAAQQRRRSGRRLHRLAVAIAAGVVAVLVGGLWLALQADSQTLETAIAEQRSVRLPDGSRVTLAPETRLLIDRRSGGRAVRLERGEAYFEVAHDPAHPFVVRVTNHEAVAIGTAFNVEAQGDRMIVTVAEGVVGLRTVIDNGNAHSVAAGSLQELRLRVGDRAAADRNGERALPAVSQPESIAAWRNGRLEYLNQPLRAVIDDVNRYTERRIVLTDPAVGDLLFTGTVLLDGVDAWFDALAATFPVEIVERGDQRILQRSTKWADAALPPSRPAADPVRRPPD